MNNNTNYFIPTFQEILGKHAKENTRRLKQRKPLGRKTKLMTGLPYLGTLPVKVGLS